MVNHWRKNTLNLEPLPAMVGANLANYLKVPFTYCWSPALIPKPFDWPSHIGLSIYPNDVPGSLTRISRRLWILLPHCPGLQPIPRIRSIPQGGTTSNLYWLWLHCDGRPSSDDSYHFRCGSNMWGESYCVRGVEQAWKWR